MDEYIEREAVIKYLAKCADGYSYIETPTESAIADIKAIPAADVRPVVRCRECKNWVNEWWCRKHPNFRVINPNWYCASGERKGGDE